MTVRTASAEDVEQVVSICKEFQAISPYKDHLISDEKFRGFVTHYLTPKPMEHVVLIWEKDGEILGILAAQATVGAHFFSENRIATELVWYVKPNARTGTAPIRLLHAYEDWAKLIGCVKVSLTAVCNEHREMLTKMYEKMGYQSTEETFVRNI